MPIPLLLLVPAITSGVYGAYRGIKAAVDNSDAGDISGDARTIYEKSTHNLNSEKERCNAILGDYGRKKLQAFNSNIPTFIELFSQIKNVELSHSPNLDTLKLGDFSSNSLKELTSEYEMLKSSGLGLGAGLTGGAATAFGAYGGTMMLASASTGTAISSLSGVAATNATLAWLGGGSIAAGGGGMAMGTMVLGGLVAGPALLIFGSVMGNKAETALNDARSDQEKAKKYRDEAQLAVLKMRAITSVALLASNTFSKLSGFLRHANQEMKFVLQASGTSFQQYTDKEKEVIFKAVKAVQLIKAMIDLPILDEEGTLVLTTEKRIVELNETA